jgi:CRISPR/Cas system CMR subunit Cmr6 (Cas7 group RAMP superfamily)
MAESMPTGQDTALILAEMKKLSNKIDNLEEEGKKKDAKIKKKIGELEKKNKTIDELMKKLNEKDEAMAALLKRLDEYEKQEGKSASIVESMVTFLVNYIKDHPHLVATAVATGITFGLLSFYGIPFVCGAIAATGKIAIYHGCVAGGSTLLIGDLVVSKMGKKKCE